MCRGYPDRIAGIEVIVSYGVLGCSVLSSRAARAKAVCRLRGSGALHVDDDMAGQLKWV